jgi:CrcB protein
MFAVSSWPPLLLVALGGGLGAVARYFVGRWSLGAFGPDLPLGTLVVNISGGLAMGLLAGWLARPGSGAEHMRLLLGVGVLGGFTTFSAFSLEVVTMLERGDALWALGYALASVTGAVLAVFAGLWLARA